MLSTYAVAYLFLGGAAAGTFVVACLFDLLCVRQTFGAGSLGRLSNHAPAERALTLALVIALAALILGISLLAMDLGHADRVLGLLLHPTFSLISLGAYALVILGIIGAFLCAVRLLFVPAIPQAAVELAEWLAVLVGLVTAAYTGLLLQTIVGIPFWHTPCIPVLFVLSSLSCGLAVVMVVCALGKHHATTFRLVALSARWDVAIIAAEAIVAVILVALAIHDTNQAVQLSAQALLQGSGAALWWFGFVLCGLALPAVAEAHLITSRRGSTAVVAAAAFLALIGACCLRFCIAEVGVPWIMTL